MARCGSEVPDPRTHWMSAWPTPRQSDMHGRLFGPDIPRGASVSDAAVYRILDDLRAAPELRSFRLWLVGSRLEPGRQDSDVDLVLSPGNRSAPDEQLVADALWHCREYGLYETRDPCVIDPCFRSDGPARDVVPLPPRALITTVKLLSPRMMGLARRGRLRMWRPFGDVALAFVRRACDTGYYAKLPLGDFAGAQCRYLRPAVEIDSDTRHLAYRAPTDHTETGGSHA
jgi:hypothetical protein